MVGLKLPMVPRKVDDEASEMRDAVKLLTSSTFLIIQNDESPIFIEIS